jgi:hypothetical protein
MSSPIITLTTDFGSRDGFVAAMKGVILNICPDATLVDISHEVPPHDIAHGAFVLGSASQFFPQGTIHLAVVDPGVGSSRHPLLLVTHNGYFVGPDNGIFSYVVLADLQRFGMSVGELHGNLEPMSTIIIPVPQACEAYILNRADYWLDEISSTFHGRDIFAPVAAHLARGIPSSTVGQELGEIKFLNIPQPVVHGDTIFGHVIFVDHFGNLITNIPTSFGIPKDVEVNIARRTIAGLSQSYSDATLGLLAIAGSHGYIEIAVRRGSAAQLLNAGVGTRLEVKFP